METQVQNTVMLSEFSEYLETLFDDGEHHCHCHDGECECGHEHEDGHCCCHHHEED